MTKISEAPISRMRRITIALAALAAFGLAVVAIPSAKGQSLSVLHSFSGADGSEPGVTLIRDQAGNLYGTTVSGGASSSCCGTVFKLDTHGNFTVLHSFTAGDGPPGRTLIMDQSGNLYGTTIWGGDTTCKNPGVSTAGCGTVFKLDISGKLTVLHRFTNSPDGAAGAGVGGTSLIMDGLGNLYGTTANGGTGTCVQSQGCGTVFKLDTSGNETILYSFKGGSDGANPNAVTMDQAGNLYGTTANGGTGDCHIPTGVLSIGCGTVFKLEATGNQRVLHSFIGKDGANPSAGLIIDGLGNLYGTAYAGGMGFCSNGSFIGGCGTVFKLNISGNFTVLHSFTGRPSDGAGPEAALILDQLGSVYGTTLNGGSYPSGPPPGCTGLEGCGTIFKLETSGKLTVLYTFGLVSAQEPLGGGGLVMDTDGNLYGTSPSGGAYRQGTVFKLSIGAPGVPTILSAGIAGTFGNTVQPGEWVSIYGTSLASSTMIWNGDFPTSLGGTSVTINGKAAYLSYVSLSQINLQAPDDTSTGPVSLIVTTAGGTAAARVWLAPVVPSFFTLDGKHVAGLILRPNGSGSYGGGTYDIIGPTGTSLGYPTVAAKVGDIIELFGTGFGPTSPAVPAGQTFAGAAPTTNRVTVAINGFNASVRQTFAGLSGAGLYQINLTLPAGLGTGDVSLAAVVGSTPTPPGVVISLQ